MAPLAKMSGIEKRNTFILQWTEPLSEVQIQFKTIHLSIDEEVQIENRSRYGNIESIQEFDPLGFRLTFIKNNPVCNSPIINLKGLPVIDSIQILQWRIAKGIDKREKQISCLLETNSDIHSELTCEIEHLCHDNYLDYSKESEKILITLPDRMDKWFYFKDQFENLYKRQRSLR